MNFFLYELLPTIFNMSITGSIVIVAVLAIRLLLKKAPKIFSYAIWVVVLFKLVCPLTFESAIGFLPSSEPIPVNIVHEEYPQVDLPLPIINDAINENLPQGEEQVGADPLEAVVSIATLMWAVGVFAMQIYSVVQYVLLKRKLIGSTPFKENIYLADGINSPFVMGLFSPKIYMPSSLPKNEYDFIIAHEKCHIKRLDHITRVLAFIALAVHWFNPLVWVAYIVSAKDMEMSCDEAVMKNMGSDIKGEYATSLLRIATGKKLIVATPLAFGEGDTKDRVKNVMKYKKPLVWVSVICLVLLCVIAIALMSTAKQEEFISSSISFSDEKEFEFTLNEANTSTGFGNTVLNKGDEVKISISSKSESESESEAEIQVGIIPTDEFDNTTPAEFIGETVLLTNALQEIVVEVPNDDMYKVWFMNTTNEYVLATGTVEYIIDLNNIEPITAMITEIDRENFTMKAQPLDSSSELTESITLDVESTIFTNGEEDSSIENFSVGYLVDVYVNLNNVVENTMFPFMISMNGETSAISLKTLWENRTEYVGDNSAVGNIISNLSYPTDVRYENFSLDTYEEPFGLTVNLESDEDISNVALGDVSGFAEKNSAILFSLIGNVDNISFNFSDGYSMSGITFYRSDLESIYGEDLFSKTETFEDFDLLFSEIFDVNSDAPLNDLIPMVMIDGNLYLDTGELPEDTQFQDAELSDFDGTIASTVNSNEKPNQNDQSNFGEGFGYRIIDAESVAIYINEEWYVYKLEEKAPLELNQNVSADGEIALTLNELLSYSFNTNSEQLSVMLDSSEEVQVSIMLYDAKNQDSPLAQFDLQSGETNTVTNLTSTTSYILKTNLIEEIEENVRLIISD